MEVSLLSLTPGLSGFLKRFELDSSDKELLESVGLVQGRTVKVVRKGSSVLVNCAGACLAIDPELAKGVYLTQN